MSVPLVRRNLPVPGGTVMDVGCRGSHFAIKAIDRGASRVICVDPTDEALRLFDLHKMHNRHVNMEFVSAALAERVKPGSFWYGSPGETFSGLARQTFDVNGSVIVDPSAHRSHMELITSTLDVICTDLQRLDLLVLQTNGKELAILQGGREALARLRPVVFVTTGQILSERAQVDGEVAELMSSIGYRRVLMVHCAEVYSPTERDVLVHDS